MNDTAHSTRRRSQPTAREIVAAMAAAGVVFRFRAAGPLIVEGLACLSPALREQFFEGEAADLYRAARAIEEKEDHGNKNS